MISSGSPRCLTPGTGGDDLTAAPSRPVAEPWYGKSPCGRQPCSAGVAVPVLRRTSPRACPLEVRWGTEVVVDGKEHDRFDWAGFAEAKRHSLPAELAGSLMTGCEASGFSRPRTNLGKTLVTRRRRQRADILKLQVRGKKPGGRSA
jgi:hypothetical protein